MSTRILDIAIVQANTVWENVPENIVRLSNLIATIDGSPDIVILPEMFTTGFSLNAHSLAEPHDGVTTRWMKDISKNFGFAICGSIIVKQINSFYNRFIFVTPQGNVFSYDKRHLFTYANEHLTFTHGNKRVVIDYLGWRILPQICYDLRFPVWSRNRNDYDLMINVANFPSSRRDIWITLLKARAIENQCFVAAANRVGVDGMSINYSGDSMVINPIGQVVTQDSKDEELVLRARLNMDELNSIRADFPVLRDADSFSL
jgi:predicted amidohydrolase